MILSQRLSIYIGKQFAVAYAAVLAVVTILIFIKDLLTYAHKALNRPDMTGEIVVRMAALLVPSSIELLTPFAILAAGMIVMRRLTRHHELIAVRAAGISVWQFIAPALTVALLLSALMLAFVNPLSAESMRAHAALDRQYLQGKTKVFEFSSVGIWLRETREGEMTVVHADRAETLDGAIVLTRPSFLILDRGDRFKTRIDARSAILGDGVWHLQNVAVAYADGRTDSQAVLELPTGLTRQRIAAGAPEPEMISFWQLPETIEQTEQAGFASVRYRVQWNSQLAVPMFYVAIMLIAATFSLRMSRQRGTMGFVVIGLITGFSVVLMKFVMVTLGNAGQVPVELAAWTPAVATCLLGLAALMHVEDG